MSVCGGSDVTREGVGQGSDRPPGDVVDGHRAGQCTGDRRGCCIHDSTTVGRFYLVYLEYNPPVADVTNPNPTPMAMSYVDTSGTRPLPPMKAACASRPW